MKSSHKWLIGAALVAVAGRAELAQWVQHIPGASALESVFFRDVAMPAGVVKSRRPPRETVAELTKQIAAAPSRADLVTLRAHEAELNLDFTTAEQDWKTYARLAVTRWKAPSLWPTTTTGDCSPRRNWRHCWRRRASLRLAAMH